MVQSASRFRGLFLLWLIHPGDYMTGIERSAQLSIKNVHRETKTSVNGERAALVNQFPSNDPNLV